MKSLIKLNPEQLQYLKSLDSKKKKRKFLLDCLVEEIEVKNLKAKAFFFIEGESIPIDDELFNFLDNHPMKENWFSTTEKEIKKEFDEMVRSSEKTYGLPKQQPILTGNPMVDSINIGISAIENIREAYKAMDERKEVLEKSKQPQPPTDFCVEITDENRDVLQKVWDSVHKTNGKLAFDFLLANSSLTICFSVSKNDVDSQIVTTEEFLKYIGREDLIDKNESLTQNDLEGYGISKTEDAVKITLDNGCVIWKTKWDVLEEPKK